MTEQQICATNGCGNILTKIETDVMKSKYCVLCVEKERNLRKKMVE